MGPKVLGATVDPQDADPRVRTNLEAVSARFLIAVALLLGAATMSAPVVGASDLVISNVTVIDPESRRVLPDRSVVVSAGRIVEIGSSATGSRQAAESFAGDGMFLIPGLIDMHVHLSLTGVTYDPMPTLEQLLAHGVTGVRDMSSDCWLSDGDRLCLDRLEALAREIEAGIDVGIEASGVFAARILALSSAPVGRSGPTGGERTLFAPATAREGRVVARYLHERGVDLVKVYNSVPRDAYFALAKRARRLDLEVSGHLPLGVSLVEAARAGHRTVEHARDLPLACSSYGSTYRQAMESVVLGDPSGEQPLAKERLTRTLAGFDRELCDSVLDVLVENDTILVPTHGTREMDARASEESYRGDERRRFVSPELLARWDRDLDNTAEVAAELAELYREFFELGLRLTRLAHERGVRVLVGTDANDTVIFPGSGVHDEMERFARAGIEPMDILRSATTLSAEALGRGRDHGAVAKGKVADLVILRADPLGSIANVREIEAVILGGRLYDRNELEARLTRLGNAESGNPP